MKKNAMNGKWATILSLIIVDLGPAIYARQFPVYWWIGLVLIFILCTGFFSFLYAGSVKANQFIFYIKIFFQYYETKKGDVDPEFGKTPGQWLIIYLIAILTCISPYLLVSAAFIDRTFIVIGSLTILVLFLVGSKGLKAVALFNLNKKVSEPGKAEIIAVADPVPEEAHRVISERTSLVDPVKPPVEFELISADKFPEASANSITYFDELHVRFQLLIKLYNRHILLLAAIIILLKTLSNSLLNHLWFPFLESLYWYTLLFTAGWMFFTVVVAPSLVKSVINRTKGNKQYLQSVNWAKRLKPNITPLLGILWTLIAIGYATELLINSSNVRSFIFAGLLVVIVLWYYYSVRLKQRILENKYPLNKPHKLLLLRVFGSNTMADFMALIGCWRWFGTTNFLDGPDTAGEKMSYIINFLKGNVEDSIIENKQELETEIARATAKPDRHLRFPVFSMQCNNATWKDALQYFLTESEVIVVDLSGMTKQNIGIAYELEKIILEIPIGKVLFLINESTDRETLFSLLNNIVLKLPETSPNYSNNRITIRFFDYGGSLTIKVGETFQQWQQRIQQRVLEKNIVCMILDIARSFAPAELFQKEPPYPWARWSWRDLSLNVGSGTTMPDEKTFAEQ